MAAIVIARPAPGQALAGTGRAAIEVAPAFVAEAPAAIRLLLIEPWRRGGEALGAHERLLDHFADLLAASRTEAPGGEELPAIFERLLVAALVSILAQRIDPEKRRGLDA